MGTAIPPTAPSLLLFGPVPEVDGSFKAPDQMGVGHRAPWP